MTSPVDEMHWRHPAASRGPGRNWRSNPRAARRCPKDFVRPVGRAAANTWEGKREPTSRSKCGKNGTSLGHGHSQHAHGYSIMYLEWGEREGSSGSSSSTSSSSSSRSSSSSSSSSSSRSRSSSRISSSLNCSANEP
eukprot:GHVT01090049.1.p2 GENE.GHVT01090049.1~~GHVT01090049.1.p2  ORF type:complete len:137 (-),score=42.31 GHVT01090049.1:1267-1677(-)